MILLLVLIFVHLINLLVITFRSLMKILKKPTVLTSVDIFLVCYFFDYNPIFLLLMKFSMAIKVFISKLI